MRRPGPPEHGDPPAGRFAHQSAESVSSSLPNPGWPIIVWSWWSSDTRPESIPHWLRGQSCVFPSHNAGASPWHPLSIRRRCQSGLHFGPHACQTVIVRPHIGAPLDEARTVPRSTLPGSRLRQVRAAIGPIGWYHRWPAIDAAWSSSYKCHALIRGRRFPRRVASAGTQGSEHHAGAVRPPRGGLKSRGSGSGGPVARSSRLMRGHACMTWSKVARLATKLAHTK